MRVVGGEEAHLLARLLDDPADGLVRVGRDADLAPHVFPRVELEALQPLLVLAEGGDRGVELAHPARDPHGTLLDYADLQAREAVEDAVDDERRERLHGREGDRHVVDGAEVLRPAVEVRHRREAVREVVRVEELPAAAHVEHDRDAGFLRDLPHREEPDVARRVARGARRGNEQRLRAHRDRLLRHRARSLEVGERHVAGGEETPIDGAEVHHGAVVRAGETVGEVGIVLPLGVEQVGVQEGVEHELAREAEEVERAWAVLHETLRTVHRVRVAPGRARGYDHILDRVAEVVAALRPHAPEAGVVGIGTPGSLSARDGTLKNSNTTCLNGRPVHADLEQRLGLPVRLENDANCFALAEARDGAAVGRALVFGVILGTGVGGGLVIDGRVWAGPQHLAGEWGHHAIDPAGPECYCGQRGCVETLLSGPALEAAYRAAGGAPASVAEIAARAAAGEVTAAAVMERYLDCFGRALANVIDILDPDVVVLGGGLSNLDVLYTQGRDAVARYVFNDELTTPIVPNRLGDSAGVIGAALLTV